MPWEEELKRSTCKKAKKIVEKGIHMEAPGLLGVEEKAVVAASKDAVKGWSAVGNYVRMEPYELTARV